MDGRKIGPTGGTQVQVQYRDRLVQFSDATQELLVGGLDVLSEQPLHFRIMRAGRELTKDKIAVNALDDYPAEFSILSVPEGGRLLGL